MIGRGFYSGRTLQSPALEFLHFGRNIAHTHIWAGHEPFTVGPVFNRTRPGSAEPGPK
jgi:hypothetical protein